MSENLNGENKMPRQTLASSDQGSDTKSQADFKTETQISKDQLWELFDIAQTMNAFVDVTGTFARIEINLYEMRVLIHKPETKETKIYIHFLQDADETIKMAVFSSCKNKAYDPGLVRAKKAMEKIIDQCINNVTETA